jgi:hypothetical protein
VPLPRLLPTLPLAALCSHSASFFCRRQILLNGVRTLYALRSFVPCGWSTPGTACNGETTVACNNGPSCIP